MSAALKGGMEVVPAMLQRLQDLNDDMQLTIDQDSVASRNPKVDIAEELPRRPSVGDSGFILAALERLDRKWIFMLYLWLNCLL